jgi:hypothetical protein
LKKIFSNSHFFILFPVLQVGCWTPSQRTLSAFEIEWIPDILPQMRIGELRIKFEYGHQRNGQIERRRF